MMLALPAPIASSAASRATFRIRIDLFHRIVGPGSSIYRYNPAGTSLTSAASHGRSKLDAGTYHRGGDGSDHAVRSRHEALFGGRTAVIWRRRSSGIAAHCGS